MAHDTRGECWRGDVQRLADLTRDLSIKLDLIDVNVSSRRFRPPSCAELDAFRDTLSLRRDPALQWRSSLGLRLPNAR
jgi:hypothetical protein